MMSCKYGLVETANLHFIIAAASEIKSRVSWEEMNELRKERVKGRDQRVLLSV